MAATSWTTARPITGATPTRQSSPASSAPTSNRLYASTDPLPHPTGPSEATNYVRASALERDIPLLHVSTSTIETADALDLLIGSSTPHRVAKAHHYAALLQRHAGPDALGS